LVEQKKNMCIFFQKITNKNLVVIKQAEENKFSNRKKNKEQHSLFVIEIFFLVLLTRKFCFLLNFLIY
jgi:hypothetical protein